MRKKIIGIAIIMLLCGGLYIGNSVHNNVSASKLTNTKMQLTTLLDYCISDIPVERERSNVKGTTALPKHNQSDIDKYEAKINIIKEENNKTNMTQEELNKIANDLMGAMSTFNNSPAEK